jgi:hypothetical protein
MQSINQTASFKPEWSRLYQVYAYGVPDMAPQPWVRSVWQEIESELSYVEKYCRGPIALRGSGYRLKPDGYYGDFGYGRLGWNSKSANKWTFVDPDHEKPGANECFGHVEAWAPHWNNCFYGSGSPDFFLVVGNTYPHIRAYTGKRSWRCELLIASALDIDTELNTFFRASSKILAKSLSCKKYAFRIAPWGITSGSGFTDSIQDMRFHTKIVGKEKREELFHEFLKPEWKIEVAG